LVISLLKEGFSSAVYILVTNETATKFKDTFAQCYNG